ncbi:hypothetical protein [Bradyrhizobium sp. CCH5-F6]|jgi:hypothetical protein|uniref:hypothetical protein n=1 Tax=Bradyrhizobium sp. CCH5-F6 TaxID=1768753 RepID=UPI000AB1C9FD|nr:hypothetical protein [Bradyrhizobium sp. CCH5-F6]
MHAALARNCAGKTYPAPPNRGEGQAAGFVLQSSDRLTKLQSLQDKVSTFVAGVRSA